MFLVGMCDIFLILYLTTISQTSPYTVSEVTLEDYLELKKSEEELQRLTDENRRALDALQSRLSESEQELAEEAKRREQVLADKQSAQERLEETKAAAREAAERAEEFRSKLVRLEESKEQSEEQLASLNKEKSLLEQQAQSRAEELAEKAAALEKRSKELSQLEDQLSSEQVEKQRLAQLRRQSESAKSEAERLAREAEERAKEAANRAAQAERQALEAEEKAAEAEKQAAEARLAGAAASAKAKAAEHARSLAMERAKRSELSARSHASRARTMAEQKEEAQKKVASITQPLEQAMQQRIRPNMVGIRIRGRRDGLFGDISIKRDLAGVPIRVGSRRYAVFPRAQMGLDESDHDDYERYEVLIAGVRARSLLVRPAEPQLIAVELPSDGPAGKAISGALRSEAVMPTLIATRGSSERAFSDRIRDVSEDFFVFRRSQLKPQGGGLLHYDVRGFRGTGEYGERLLPGDQIVDLDGSVLGVAVRPNEVVRIDDIQTWKRIDLQGEVKQWISQLGAAAR